VAKALAMTARLAFALLVGGMLATSACSERGSPGGPFGTLAGSAYDRSNAVRATAGVRQACPRDDRIGFARCGTVIRTDVDATRPSGYGPADLQSAYNLPSSTDGAGQTVAVVEAYDDPNAEADLGVYRETFGLPACSASNGCFAKVNQTGQAGNYPSPNADWAVETSSDIDMVSAGCPKCNILIVEANSSSFKDLGESLDEALALGAVVASNSYSGAPSQGDEKYYVHHDAIIVAAAGDEGSSQPEAPAAFPSVVAVGGTTLKVDQHSKRGWTETAFGTGGCTTFPKPAWQHDTFCTTRTTNDVAAVADPGTGVAVYDSFEQTGWAVIGGTSVSAPLVASVYGLAGNAGTLYAAKSLYQHHPHLYDIPPTGYDEPTGWGTPDGIGAF
jgi:subtilase family serine protease